MDILVWLGIVAIVAIITIFIVKSQYDESERQYEIQRAQMINDAHVHYAKWSAERDQHLTKVYQSRPQTDSTMMDNVLGYVVADATGIPINFTAGSIIGMMEHASHQHHDASPSYDSGNSSSSYDSGSSSYDSGSSSSGGDF